jgi:DNA-binding transcriptional ArsR family regulator
MADDRAQLAALGAATRGRIFELVAARPRSVAEVTTEMEVSQSAFSQHFKMVRESRLVRAEAKGANNV